MKSTKWHIVLKKPRAASLTYLCMLLISLLADIETNPGPIDYPCGNCALKVQETDPAIECDDCGQWFHIQCESIGQSTFDDWVYTDRSFSWVCSKCESLNFSNSAPLAFGCFTSRNSFSILSEEHSKSSKPSSLSPPWATGNKKFSDKLYNLKALNINCQSIVNEKSEFHAPLDKLKLDIVVGTESWLTSNHFSIVFFPKSLGFTLFRQAREADTSGGAVFILVTDTFLATEQKQLKTNCEIIWVKIDMIMSKPLYVAAYYRPKKGDVESTAELRRSLYLVSTLKGNTWVLGDFDCFSFPGIRIIRLC